MKTIFLCMMILISVQLFSAVLLVPSQFATIQSAINAALSGDEIIVADGVYSGVGNTNLIWYNKDIYLHSENGVNNCILDGGGVNRIFNLDLSGSGTRWITSASVIEGFTMQHGYCNVHNEGGGAMRIDADSYICAPIIRNNKFVDNSTAYYGGAIEYYYGLTSPTNPRCTIEDNVFTGNSAINGGAISFQYSELIIRNNTFTNNVSTNGIGGALHIYNGSVNDQRVLVTSNVFDGNHANGSVVYGHGGAIGVEGMSGGLFEKNIIKNNTAFYFGGGIYIGHSTPHFENNLIYNNSTSNYGSAVVYFNFDGGSFINNTVSGNTGDAAIHCYGYNGNVDPQIYNNIIWGHSASFSFTGTQNVPVIAYNTIQGGFPAQGVNNGQNIYVDPVFVNSTINNYRLNIGSPCISAANEAIAPVTDILGRARPQDDGVEMGAYEFFDDGTLPVELSSFTAVYTVSNTVSLNWTTESESNMLGYHVFRNSTELISTAEKISTSVVNAVNQSETHHYSFNDPEVEQDTRYYYWLQSVELDGSQAFFGPIHVLTGHNTTDNPDLLRKTGIQSVYPNPFNPRAQIKFFLEKDSFTELIIYNQKGQKVSTLINDFLTAGHYQKNWTAVNDANVDLSSGIYYCVLKSDGKLFCRKMILLK